MNADLGKKDFADGEVAELRERLAMLRKGQSLSWKQLSGLTGIPETTIQAFVTGTYKGVQENIAARANRFFVAYDEQQALASALPVEPDFQMTPSAQRMMTVLAMAHLGDIAVISTPPGCGKTATLIQYAATRQPTWRVAMAPSARGAPTMLLAILAAMGERAAKGTPQALSGLVRSRGAGGLLLVDEAQHLTAPALEELRSIHDDTGMGVALVGDENLLVNLSKYPQLYSRVGIRHLQPHPDPGDIMVLAEAWKIETGPELAFLLQIGRKGGGLRTITKTLKLAQHVANAGGAPLCVGDLRDAYAHRGFEALL